MSAVSRGTRSNDRYRRGDVTRRTIGGTGSTREPAVVGGFDPPNALAWLLALARGSEPSRALTASGLLWLFVYAGWRAGVLDAAATLWLSASVVAVNHVLRAAERPRGRQTAREPGGERRPVESRVGR